MDYVTGLFGSYWGSLGIIAIFCVGMAFTVTLGAERYEKSIRARHERRKALWWPHALRGISTAVGLLSALPGRLFVSEILTATTDVPVGLTGRAYLAGVLPSVFVACFVGFLAGFFLTLWVWAAKKLARTERAQKIAPGLASGIGSLPDIGAPTETFDLDVNEDEQP